MNEQPRPQNIIVRVLDPLAVLLVKALIVMTHLRARDPTRNAANLLRADPGENVHLRSWQSVLETWSAQKRVACLIAVIIGISLGTAVLYLGVYGLPE